MRIRRIAKLLLSSFVAAVIGFLLILALGVLPPRGFIVPALFVVAAGGTVIVVYDKDGKLQRPKLLATIVAIVIAVCVGLLALAWYVLANSTDL